jgi:hypothetical protein
MSQLPPIWKPSAVLDIITATNDISCAGITLKGLPCGWTLDGEAKLQARQLLTSMSQMSPREALDDLPRLARLCLCQKNHQKQAARVVKKWADLIESYPISLEREDNRQTNRPVSHGGNINNISSNRGVRATRSDGPIPSYDEIIAELEALSIRQKELRSMLQDSHSNDEHKKPKDESTHSSPSQYIAREANQAQLSDSEFSRDGQDQSRGSSSSRDGWKRVFARGKALN